MKEKPKFKTYCWVVGSTSFREKQLAYKNEVLIRYLNQLFEDNPNKKWRELQEIYYDNLKNGGFIMGEASRKDKDARQKTTGLAQIGLCYPSNRHVTPVGASIVQLSKKGDFESKNIFEINEDSFVYLLQFLKYQIIDGDNGFYIKPFLSLMYMIIKLGYLSRSEFTYLLPICKTTSDVVEMTSEILNNRGNLSVDSILLKKMSGMPNYQDALHLFLTNPGFSDELVMDVGIHRKSRLYDKPFAPFFTELFKLVEDQDSFSLSQKIIEIGKLRTCLNAINDNQATSWRQLFGLQKTTSIDNSFVERFYKLNICKHQTEEEFKKNVFWLWHLMKWKSTLEDYYDLNKRYFYLTDIIKFDNQQFTLTEVGFDYFFDIIDKVLVEPLVKENEYEQFFTSNVPLAEISPLFIKTKENIAVAINERYGKRLTASELDDFLNDMYNKQFLAFIDSRFPKEVLISLLDYFKSRDDESIKEIVTQEATVPTSFEYIVGIIWYNLCGREGRLKDFIKLSLDSNFLPKSHAVGGEADLVFSYKKTHVYPKHDLLVEVTLSESTGQRHMEWEPVSRHLETHIKQTHNESDYCIFIASDLEERTTNTFRNSKNYHFNDNGVERIGLKIIPLDCSLLKILLSKEIMYPEIYSLFDDAYTDSCLSLSWYRDFLETPINKI